MSQEPLRSGLKFSEIIGLDLAKKSLMCVATDDSIKGVLIRGPPGTAKSVLMRSFADRISDRKVIDVPQNVSDDQLIGGMDLEKAMNEGRSIVSEGILRRADGNYLYIDNINLFDPRTASQIMESVLSGRVRVEREGISAEYSLDTAVLATMDPAEKELSDTILDRFDISVSIFAEEDLEKRADIVSLSAGIGKIKGTPISDENDSVIKHNIESARSLISKVRITKDVADKISRICTDLGVKGYRGDISAAKVARALAALDGRDFIADDDIRDAAIMCLTHRRSVETDDDDLDEISDDVDLMEEVEVEKNVDEIDLDEVIADREIGGNVPVYAPKGEDVCDRSVEIINSIIEFEEIRLHEVVGIKNKRADISQKSNSGRYARSRIPEGKAADPAFDATVRAAAPYQRFRESNGLSISIEPQDIREKVRVKRDRCSFLFMVDTSGSLVVGRMMEVVQGAIRSMLKENYVKRDKVALMTFRADTVDIPVPFTRSVETVCETLVHTPTGDATPLNAALLRAREYLINYLRKHPDEKCYVILITDGQGNVPVEKGREPISELKKIASVMDLQNTDWTVVDSGDGLGKKDAQRLAKWLSARYVRLSDLGEY